MTFRRGGAGKKRDANEADIIAVIKSHGVQVWQLSGRGIPDLLLYDPRGGRYYVGEVKTAKGRKTDAQQDQPWPVWRTATDALVAIGRL